MSLPVLDHVYQNHHLDSTRWDDYVPRDDDIIVSTSYKAGTTFTQNILLEMLHGGSDPMPTLDISPWVDARFVPFSAKEIHGALEAQKFRRFLKTHLPLDGMPYFSNVKYIIVCRDPRDVFMSLINHYNNYSPLAFQAFNSGEPVGKPMPSFKEEFNEDVRAFWKSWISRGWFDWESEGYPFWGNMHHAQTYWNYRELPNFHFLHYADLLADLEGSVRDIATFIDHPVSDAEVARIVDENTFSNVKKKAITADANADPNAPEFFKGGQAGFIFKGTNGRWKDVLTAEDLALYEDAKKRLLSDGCAEWLESGGKV
jgi:aryl sulfotransferase